MLGSSAVNSVLRNAWLMAVLMAVAQASTASAFQLLPEATDNEGKIRTLEQPAFSLFLDDAAKAVMRHFTTAVHEEITHRVYRCDLPNHQCGKSESTGNFAPAAVIAGVRWNDNPPFSVDDDLKAKFKTCRYDFTAFKLPNFSKCWIDIFRDARKNAPRTHYRARPSGLQYALIYRVHFGDMQFLHSMGSWDGELARDTKARVMMWAEFAYRFARGEIPHNGELRKTGVSGMEQVFQGTNWTAERLFTMDDTTFRSPELMRQMALGSLLHTIQDSFSMSHVKREKSDGKLCATLPDRSSPGRVLLFYAYNDQNSSKHGDKDSADGFDVHMRTSTPNVIEIGEAILKDFNDGKSWTDFGSYVDCLYELADEYAPAEAGLDYQR